MGLSERRAPLAGFIAGVFVSQVANNALHLAQPLLMAQLSGSLAFAAVFACADTVIHMAATLGGGWPADRFGSRRLLIASTLGRAAALCAIPIAWAAGRLTLTTAACAYCADALARGLVDTSVHALPMELVGRDGSGLDAVNSRYEAAFDLGAVAGPLALSALLLASHALAASALIPAGFAAAAAAFCLVPKTPARGSRQPQGTWQGLRLILSRRTLAWPCLGLAALNLYPLRKLIAAFFAKALLGQVAAAGWIGAAFGLGGVLGSALYGWRGRRLGEGAWLVAAALGLAGLAAALLPASLAVMLAAAFFFSLTNAGARLAVTRRLQEATPEGAAGGVMAVARACSNSVSVGLKAAMAGAFALGASPAEGFAWLGAGLGAIALIQLAFTRPLTACHMPVTHGLPSSYGEDEAATLE